MLKVRNLKESLNPEKLYPELFANAPRFRLYGPVPPPKMRLTVQIDDGSLEEMRASTMKKIEEAHEAGMQAVVETLTVYLAEMMAAGWAWTDGARDIIDTGQLLSSASVELVDDGILIAYGTPYASIVHYGGYIAPYGNKNAEKVYLPGRPWVAAVLGEADGPLPAMDWVSVYKDAAQPVLDS